MHHSFNKWLCVFISGLRAKFYVSQINRDYLLYITNLMAFVKHTEFKRGSHKVPGIAV